jgi:hypothetical protein
MKNKMSKYQYLNYTLNYLCPPGRYAHIFLMVIFGLNAATAIGQTTKKKALIVREKDPEERDAIAAPNM